MDQETKKIITLVPVFVLIIVAGVLILFMAPAFVESTLPNNSYLVRITGLDGIPANGSIVIMVPIPSDTEGNPVFSDKTIKRRNVTGWDVSIGDTAYGKMLVFSASQERMSDIFMPLGEFEQEEERRLLVPVLQTPDNISISDSGLPDDFTYTTAIFIDCNITSLEPETTLITVTLEFEGGGGMIYLVKEDIWRTKVQKVLSGNECGFVPIQAEYSVIKGGIKF